MPMITACDELELTVEEWAFLERLESVLSRFITLQILIGCERKYW